MIKFTATSSTHGNTMGGRTIFPSFSCLLLVCTITAPPNANVSPPGWHQLFVLVGPTPSHSVWVQIGGDPAGLGGGPRGPPFLPPGGLGGFGGGGGIINCNSITYDS